MPAISFIGPDGHEQTHEGAIGMSVMEVAVRHGVEGILALCGGARACATCHVYVEEPWLDATGVAVGDEADMLGFATAPSEPNSRLSCQIRLTRALDGLRVRVARNGG